MHHLIPSGPVTSLAACSLACAVVTAHSAETASRKYDIPRGGAVETLRRFVEISGRQVVYLTDAVRHVTTNPVRGEYTARDALARLIADTGLVVEEDVSSGALMVNPSATEDPAATRRHGQPSPRSHGQPENYPRTKTSL
ncbi:MAG: STN domain-containing protein, partial [Opitutaceae bacterium]